jgi:perosamine synthetase
MTVSVTAIPLSAPLIGDEEKQAVLAVLDSGMLVQGPVVAELERGFAEIAGTLHAVAVSSGTAALHLALLANGIGPGDEVITSPFSFVATANAIMLTGARPVFVDVSEDTFNLDPDLVAAAITRRTRAIMPVHLYGLPCDMDPLLEVARERQMMIIEDAAQAVGARYRGRTVGSFGTGCFSLYATKNVMSAEGGIVTTNDDDVADRLRLLRNQGMRARYEYESIGYNFRLSDLHAAIGVVQLRRLSESTRRRKQNAFVLSAGLTSVALPVVPEGFDHVWHQYTVRIRGDRNAAIAILSKAGVGTAVFYPKALHELAHVRRVTGDFSCPVATRLAGEVLSLPVHPKLSARDLDRIVEAVNAL